MSPLPLRKDVPPHTRLILASDKLLETWGARSEDGYRISAEWGEQKPEGWYEPTFTKHLDDNLIAEATELLADLLADGIVANSLRRKVDAFVKRRFLDAEAAR